MLGSDYNTDFFNIKPSKSKKLKLGTQQEAGDTEEGVALDEGDTSLPTADEIQRREPDKTRKGFGTALKVLMGIGDMFSGGKVSEITKDYVFPAFKYGYEAFGSDEQKRKLEDLEVATFGLKDSNQDWVKVRTPQQPNPFAPKKSGAATAQNAFGVMKKAESIKYNEYDDAHPTEQYLDRWHMTLSENPLGENKIKHSKKDLASGMNAFSKWR